MFALRDDSTNALDEDNQDRLFTKLKESGGGYISADHRFMLIEHHDRALTLDRPGSWEMEDADTSGSPPFIQAAA